GAEHRLRDAGMNLRSRVGVRGVHDDLVRVDRALPGGHLPAHRTEQLLGDADDVAADQDRRVESAAVMDGFEDKGCRGDGVSHPFRHADVKLASQHDRAVGCEDRKSTRLNSSHVKISYAVFCLKKKKKHTTNERYDRKMTDT